MEEEFNKRKIEYALTLEKKHMRKIIKRDFFEETIKNVEDDKQNILIEESKKDAFIEDKEVKEVKSIYKSNVGPFQLAVIKLPWYKRAFKSFMRFLGLKLEFYEF